MTPQALKALKESIAHWERLTAGALGETHGADHCPLCKAFNKAWFTTGEPMSNDCKGCPVKERTGKSYCRNTPWDAIDDDLCLEEGTVEFRALAVVELDFLKSLLPVEK